ncbi:MAG: hypothetical protein HLUCCA12_06300 [Rhodobacteraceae bacterium HLUCCA12]|nr:MAG: hypothetical protein HLUCCA12_06300 [Rhodobacteraceae bacterium HLUCCA12]
MTFPSRMFLAAALLIPSALAAEPYTYAEFEASVPHIDLETCPEALLEGDSEADVFCRVSMHNDALHIYVFETEGTQEFVALHTRYEDQFMLDFAD